MICSSYKFLILINFWALFSGFGDNISVPEKHGITQP